jgi:hypothetical protein
VFFKRSIKSGVLINFSKFFHPIHGLPIIPCSGLKSLKAIMAPYMGTYLKIISRIKAGRTRRYN